MAGIPGVGRSSASPSLEKRKNMKEMWPLIARILTGGEKNW